MLLGGVAAAPFNDALSEEVERILTGSPARPFSLSAVLSDVARTLRIETAKLLAYAAVMLPLFVASFLVPVVGHAAYVVFGFTFSTPAVMLPIRSINWFP